MNDLVIPSVPEGTTPELDTDDFGLSRTRKGEVPGALSCRFSCAIPSAGRRSCQLLVLLHKSDLMILDALDGPYMMFWDEIEKSKPHKRGKNARAPKWCTSRSRV